MATLQDLLDEQARVKNELQRMEADESVTEEDSADLRDTLVERWEELETKIKPVVARMEKVRGITRTAATDPGAREQGADLGPRTPEFMQRHDPFDNLDAIRQGVVKHSDLIARALNAA